MAQRIINLGTSPDMGDGDEIRVAFDKTNQNFTEVYTTLAGISSPVLSVAGRTGNVVITANDVIGIESYILSNTAINYDNITNKPSIPSALSQLTNDSGFITASGAKSALASGTGIIYSTSTGTISVDTNTIATVSYVATQVSNLVNSAPAALDTLKELSDALGADPNFSTTISSALGNRLRVDASQVLTPTQQTLARTNLGLATVASTGSYNDLINKPTLFSGSYTDLSNKPALSTVATSGNYNDLVGKPPLFSGSYTDLTNKPVFASVATTGSYSDLSNAPALSTVASTGSYSDLLNTPALANIAISGSYNDLSDKPVLFSGSYNDLTNRPMLFSGDYNDLINKPVLFSGNYSDLVNKPALFSGNYTDLTNKPVLANIATSGQYSDLSGTPILASVATSGSYTDLSNKPVLSNVAGSGSYNDLLDKPTLFSGSYSDLTNKPNFADIATSGEYSDLNGAPVLANVATSGNYIDLINKPAIANVATSGAYSDLIGAPLLANVATSGSYIDLSGTPVLANVATSGSYTDLFNKPVLANVATSGQYGDLSGTPALANVATSGSYTDLVNTPTNLATQSYVDTAISNLVGSSPAALDTLNELAAAINNDASFAATVTNQLSLKANISSLANVATSGNYSDLSNKPALSNVALSGSYNDLTNKPTLFSGSYNDLTNKPVLANVATSGSYTDLSNKPTLFSGSYSDLTNKPNFANVATSGSYNDLSDKPTLFSGSYNDLTNKPALSTVATSGDYTDLINKPTLFSGSYSDLTNKPNFANVATSGQYSDLSGTPVLANVAISGNYSDLTNKPTPFSGSYNDLSNKPALANVATSGSYTDLLNLPALFSGSYNDLTNLPVLFSGSYTDLTNLPVLFSGDYNDLTNKPTGMATQSYVDTAISNLVGSAPAVLDTLNELATAINNDSNFASTISNQLASKANISALANVATTGSYSDLINKPTLFSGSYNDLTNKPNFANVATSGQYSDLSGTPILANVATSGSYTDLTNKPVLANVATSGQYSDLNGTPVLANVATSGSYTDLTNKPTLFSGSYTDLTNKPVLANVATSGSYADLSNKPTLFSGSYADLSDKPTITISGDATGSGLTSITLTLANTAVTAGTYKSVTVDSKGRVTAGTNPTTISGYGITDAYTKTEVDSKVGASIQAWDADLDAIAAISGTSGLLKKTAANTWSLDTNTYLTNNQTITVSGDATGSGTTAITLTLANTAVTAGTYKSVTVDSKGRVTAGTNPTTISGYGITDAYTKTEVDNLVTGLDMKQSVRAATTANITLSGTQTIDGVSVIAGDRVLVKDQTTASQNGIYVVAASVWARATDADNTPGSEVTAGMYVFVVEGTSNADTGWVLVTNDTITLGTTALTFTQFNGLGQITAGAGLTKTGNQIDAVGTANRITVNADSIDIANTYVGQTSITTLGNITTGTWSAGTIGTAYGGTGLTSFTANGVVYASSTGALTTGNVLVFNGASLGIGTTPVQKLTVAGDGRFSAGSSYASLSVLRTDQSGVGNTDIALIDLVTGSGWARFGAYDGTNVGGNMQFYRDGSTRILNAGTEYMRFNSSGEAGIGVSPVSGIKLAVGTATGTVYQRLVTGSDNDVALQVVNSTCATAFGTDSTGGYLITQTAGKPFVFYTGGINERMRIDGSGNVGIGTTSPGAKLQVTGSTANIRLEESGTGAKRLELSIDNTAVAKISANQSASSIAFETVNAERMRIDSNGVVIIGTTTPLANTRVHVEQNSNANYSTTFVPTTTKSQLVLRDISDVTTYTNPYSAVQFGAGATGAGWSYVAGAREGAGLSFLAFGTGTGGQATERMRIDSSGNIGIGTASPANKLDVAGTVRFTTANVSLTFDSVGALQAPGGVYVNSTGTRTAGIYSSAAGNDLRIRTGNVDSRVVIDPSGNVGIAIVPQNASSTIKTLEMPAGSLSSYSTTSHYLMQGLYTNSSSQFVNKGTTASTAFLQSAGKFYWQTATAGTADALANGTGNLTDRMILDDAGNLGIGTTSPSTKLDVNGTIKGSAIQVDTAGLIDTATLTTSATTANQVLATFSATAYRTAKYLIQVTSGTAYQATELLLTHDGTTPTIVQYADIATGATLATFDADISGGNVRLLTTPTNAVTTYKLVKTMIAV